MDAASDASEVSASRFRSFCSKPAQSQISEERAGSHHRWTRAS